MSRAVLHILLLAATVVATGAQAQVMSTQPAPVDGQGPEGALPNRLQGGHSVIERLGDTVSPETQFVDHEGNSVRIGDLLDQGKPVAVAFVYHSCPMLCSLVLDGFADAIADSPLTVGEDYTALALSFDHRDTPEAASGARDKYLPMAGLDSTATDFLFWTGTEENIETFTNEVGFDFAWDAKTNEYAHTAALAFISPDGTVARYLYGVMHEPMDFRFALIEAGQGSVGTTADRVLMRCYQFNPDERSYSLAILGWMKWGGGALLLALIGGMGYFWRREVQRQNADTGPTDFPSGDFASGATPAA